MPGARKGSATNAGESPASKPTPAVSTSQLRMVFDKFDTDKSGAVSASEMADMFKLLKIDCPPSKLKQLMVEADPDGSGYIEFEEFKTVLQKQLKEGGGALAGVGVPREAEEVQPLSGDA